MIKAILNGLILALNDLVNIVTFIPDQLIESAFPDLSTSISKATEALTYIFNNLTYALGFLPVSFIDILILIFTFHIAMITISKSYHTAVRVFHLIQKIKFW